jgi:hypothetical protein
MKMSKERKALMMCMLAFLLGCVVATTGCAVGAGVRVNKHGVGVGVGVQAKKQASKSELRWEPIDCVGGVQVIERIE